MPSDVLDYVVDKIFAVFSPYCPLSGTSSLDSDSKLSTSPNAEWDPRHAHDSTREPPTCELLDGTFRSYASIFGSVQFLYAALFTG